MKEFLQRLCREAAAITWKHYGSTEVMYTKKSAADVVTKADLESHHFCIERIEKAYPSHAILSEEGEAGVQGSKDLWVIDPLDGSRNFSTATPLFGTMIAYVRDGEVLMAAICLPATDELYFAEKGGGAFLNGKPIRCSQREDWRESYGLGMVSMKAKHAALMTKLGELAKEEPYWINTIGSMAVSAAYMASGRRDWYFTMNGNVWDTSAPALLLQEAGCVLTDMHGNAWKYGAKGILASNAKLHPTLVELMKTV